MRVDLPEPLGRARRTNFALAHIELDAFEHGDDTGRPWNS